MKTLFYFLLTVLFLSYGCEQVIDMDLNDTGPQLVIEADLSHPDGLLTVVITKTSSYFEPGPGTVVDDAAVRLENKNGIRHTAVAKGNGIYNLEQVLTAVDDRFRLLVEVDGVVYSAESTLIAPVEIDSVSYSYYEGDNFFRPGYRFNVTFTDPGETKNYYRIRVYRNGYIFNRINDLVVFDDTDLNGRSVTVRLHSQYYLEEGDPATLELLSVDRQAWEYFKTLNETVNASPGTPSPANPSSCYTNGALGYFYAWSYSRMTVFVEEQDPE